MNKNKITAASSLLLVLLLSVAIILIIMVVKGGTLDYFKQGQVIKEDAKVNLQQVETSTNSYNQEIQDALNNE